MQSGGRRGGGAWLLRVDRLIALAVLQLFLDIGRQRHFAEPVEHLHEDAVEEKTDEAVPVGELRHDLGGQLAAAEADSGARTQLFPGTHETFPIFFAALRQQKDLADAAAGEAIADQSGGQHAGIVQHQAVSGLQELRQVIEVPVRKRSGLAVQTHQPGGVPARKGRLRDQLLREIEIKIRFLHFVPRGRWVPPPDPARTALPQAAEARRNSAPLSCNRIPK